MDCLRRDLRFLLSLSHVDDAAANVRLSTLQDRCFYYIIRHIDEFQSGLALLPLTIRKKLLLNLPAVDIWRLEASRVAQELDVESLWRSLIEDRCGHVSRKHFCLPFYQKMPARDLYFMFVWYEALQKKNSPQFRSPESWWMDGTGLSPLLYDVPCVLGIDGLLLSGINYPQSKFMFVNVIESDPEMQRLMLHPKLRDKQAFLAAIHYFCEVCCFKPRYFCFHCITVGKHMWVLAMQKSSELLQSFMANLEVVRFDGHGKLPNLERALQETRHERYKKFFVFIPFLFVGAAVANPHCNLRSIEIDAGDSDRAGGLLGNVYSAMSKVGYAKLQSFLLQFSHMYNSTEGKPDNNRTSYLLSHIGKLVDEQKLLRALTIQFPEPILPMKERYENLLKMFMDQYATFISTLEEYMKRPHLESLTLRNLITIDTAQQLIRTFLSLTVSSQPQLLDIRAPEDVLQGSNSFLSDHCHEPVKSLKVSGMVHDNGEEHFSSLVLLSLLTDSSVHSLEVVDSIDGIVSALKQPLESLQVKSLSLAIRKIKPHSQVVKTDTPELEPQHRSESHRITWYDRKLLRECFGIRVPYQQYRGGRRDHSAAKKKPADLPDVPQAREFHDLPRIDEIISNSSLCALKICFLSPKDFISSSQAPDFLRIVSDGLCSPSGNLQFLTLPKLEYPPDNVKEFQYFSNSVFALSHVDTFELNLSIVTFSEQYATIFHSSWKHQCEKRGTVRLAKLVLQCDTVKAESREPLILLMKDVCIDFEML